MSTQAENQTSTEYAPAPTARVVVPGARRYVALTLALALVALAAVMGFNFVVDPLQVYRQAFYPPHFSVNQRYQNPGLARNYTEPLIIIGTSHTENWLPADAEAAFGKPALKLSVAGSGLFEQGRLTDLAIETGRVERVLWGVDHGATLWLDEPTDEFGRFPHFLYGPLWRSVVPYLVSIDTLSRSIEAITEPPARGLAELNAWYDSVEFGRDRLEHAWEQMGLRWDDELYAFYQARVPRWHTVEQLMEDQMRSRIAASPEVDFDLVFMPYSVYEYVNDFRVDHERFFQRLLLKRQVSDWARSHDNLAVWDFQTRREWVFDASRYSDLAHFNLETSQAMLDDIAEADTPWPVASSRIQVEMVVEKMDALCTLEDEEAREHWCPTRVWCGRARLHHWLAGGADPGQLLDAAWLKCAGEPKHRQRRREEERDSSLPVQPRPAAPGTPEPG